MARTYKIRKFENGKNKAGAAFINYSLTLPTPIADKLVEQFGDGLEFEIELTEDGILYKPVEAQVVVPDTMPFKPGKRSAPAAAETPAKPAAPAKPKPAAKSTAKPKAAPKAAPKPAAKAAPKAAPAKPKAARPTSAKPKASGAKPSAPRAPRARPRAKVAA